MFEMYITKTGKLSCKQPQQVKNQWYISKFQEVHGDLYDYTQVSYLNSHAKVEIICEEHGAFSQAPNNHLKGKGCPACQNQQRAKTDEQCVRDFQKIHGTLYNYSLVAYINSYTKVEIICSIHGVFLQAPHDHLKGKGCPKCQCNNQDILYVLKCINTGTIKIGVTNNLVKRVSSIGGDLEYLQHVKLTNPRSMETQLHQRYAQYRLFNRTVKSGGTEFFKLSDGQVAELIQIISSHQDDSLL